MPKSGVETAAEAVRGKGAAAKSACWERGRTKTAGADCGGPEAGSAHSNPAASEAASAHSNPAASEAATAVETATVETATAKTTAGQSRARRQHRDRCGCEQDDH